MNGEICSILKAFYTCQADWPSLHFPYYTKSSQLCLGEKMNVPIIVLLLSLAEEFSVGQSLWKL